MDDAMLQTVVSAWQSAATCRIGREEIPLSFPFDVKVIRGFSPEGPARFEICSPYRPAPDGMPPQELWRRHFAWMCLRDPVHGGVWPPDRAPGRLFVSLFDPEPVAVPEAPAEPQAVLEGIAAFRQALGPVPVTLVMRPDQAVFWRSMDAPASAPEIDIVVADGAYPAHHPGIAMARGLYPYEFRARRYAWAPLHALQAFARALARAPEAAVFQIAIAGCAKNGIARLVPFSTVRREELGAPADSLLVQGGLLTGDAVDGAEVSAVPWHDRWTFLASSNRREFLWFMNPGFSRDSSSPLFASRWLPWVRRELGADLRGEKRFCIACNRCELHCPAGLDPQYLWKCVSRGFWDEADAHGLHRCLECGLCAYACPSKIELLDEFRRARARYRRSSAPADVEEPA